MKTAVAGNTRELSAEAATGSDYKLMGGMAAAFAGVMAKMGLKSSDEEASVTSGSSGIVSKRMSLLQNGAEVSPIYGGAAAPSFIDIPTDMDASVPEMLEADEGIEVEGPYRPSTQYAV
jgi:hypothetical protein